MTAFFGSRHIAVGALLASVLLVEARAVEAYVYCGFHDRGFPMRAFHFNSEFWVDQLADEVARWNTVHPVIQLSRERPSTVPVGNDGRNVISWIGEADLMSNYNLSWSNGGTVGWTISWLSSNCGRVEEADVFFWPGISLFTPQRNVPYSLGYQEIALHELGHVLTQDHEDTTLAVMTSGQAVSDVLYTSDKVGWLRSADFSFAVTDRSDMGVFPLRNNGASKVYGQTTPTTVRAGDTVTLRDMTVQNLSSGLGFTGPAFDVLLEPTAGGASRTIGNFSWGNFCAYCSWSGDLTFRVPSSTPAGNYRVVVQFRGTDSDPGNDRAVFRTIAVLVPVA